MLSVNMFSKADTIKGQGVLSAYNEQINLLKTQVPEILVYENSSKKCDIAHFHTINFKYYCMIPFLQKDVKTVAYVHFLPETLDNSINLSKPIKNIFYKYVISFYNSVDRLVVVNPYFIERLTSYGIDKSKITYIPNFVSKDNFYKKEISETNKIRKKYGFKEHEFIVLGVGQLQTRKGVLDFIDIARNIPEVKFVWAGGAVFGKITDGYEKIQYVIKNDLPKNVHFLGLVEREEMNDIYNMSDVMFLPSYEELFPMSILEAMCVELPVITRDVDLYKNILFDYYISGTNNQEFKELILKLKTDKRFLFRLF